ncbi:MAG: hypothetical protein DRH90_18270 [Deltaproteobacteria bacterium]|nr:MAG: hypothetical protein DRH90_18270 [Deltaproteobacteria bacterium]RLC09649.1 MAG: hypothetical protein DRI24_21455 [Deltaproteobacteria bacterium]
MQILDDLISTLNFNASIKDIRQGVFHTGVLTRYCGLAATLPQDALRQEPPMVKEPGFLLHRSPIELARLSYSPSILEADNLIPRADVVAITGTALTNHTMEHLLGLCSPNAYVIALGDTAPLSTILFDHGLDAISGTRVYDANLALRCVSQGGNFRQIKGVKRLTLMKQKE